MQIGLSDRHDVHEKQRVRRSQLAYREIFHLGRIGRTLVTVGDPFEIRMQWTERYDAHVTDP